MILVLSTNSILYCRNGTFMDSPLRIKNMFHNQKKRKRGKNNNFAACTLRGKINNYIFVLFTTCSQRTRPNLGLTPPNISERNQTLLFLPMRMRFTPQKSPVNIFGLSLLFSMLLNQNALLSLTHAAQQEAFRALVLCVVRQLDLSSAAESLRTEGTTSHEHKRNKLCFCKSRSGSPHERQRRAER